MIKSRLRVRRPTMTVSVKQKSGPTSGQYSETTPLTGLTATHSQPDAKELVNDAGQVVTVTDVFYFEPAAGASLPAITEQHVIVDSSNVRYEVIMVQNAGGGGNRLKVLTQRLRGSS